MPTQLIVFITTWLVFSTTVTFAQEIEGVIENSQLPDHIELSIDRVAIQVELDSPIEQKNSTSSLANYVTNTYIINQSGHPIPIRRTSISFDSNWAIEYKNEQNIWQRIAPQNQQFHLCGTGLSTTEFQLATGRSFVEPLILQKYGGKKHKIRIRICVGGKNYYSNPQVLEINIDPAIAEQSENDDWSIAYGSISRLESIIRGNITVNRNPPLPNMILPKALAIQSLSKPWHDPNRVQKILEEIINSDDAQYHEMARDIQAKLKPTE